MQFNSFVPSKVFCPVSSVFDPVLSKNWTKTDIHWSPPLLSEQISAVFHQYETGVRSGRIRSVVMHYFLFQSIFSIKMYKIFAIFFFENWYFSGAWMHVVENWRSADFSPQFLYFRQISFFFKQKKYCVKKCLIRLRKMTQSDLFLMMRKRLVLIVYYLLLQEPKASEFTRKNYKDIKTLGLYLRMEKWYLMGFTFVRGFAIVGAHAM